MRKKYLLFYPFIFSFALRAAAQQPQQPVPTPQWRPVYHFTPLQNWTNDPNGLIYLDGEYHLYNQQNPFENKWGHMSWGHAVSTDLVHWKHLPVAIPEKIGRDTTWIFSGCAVWDKNNSSGFCSHGGCLVAIYTAHQPNLHKESQYIAYSNDRGMSFTNYDRNPVIDLHQKDFRDPNVSWNAQLQRWLMVVASPRENKLLFYTSKNLKNWDSLGAFGPAGLDHGIWECPSLIRVPVKGHPDRKKWILMSSFGGGGKPLMQYFVGDFNGKTFTNDNAPDKTLLVDGGDCFYAAIPWNNLPDDKKILIGWLVPGAHETYPWKGQMSIPRDLYLRETAQGYRLVQEPSAVIKNNLAKLSGNRVTELKNLQAIDNTIPVQIKHNGNAYWMEAVLDAGQQARAGFRIAEKKDKAGKRVSGVTIGFDPAGHRIYVDKSGSGDQQLKKELQIQTMEVDNQGGKIFLEILVDQSSLEVFVNHGEQVLSTYIYPDKDATGLSFFASGGTATLQSIKIWDLSPIK